MVGQVCLVVDVCTVGAIWRVAEGCLVDWLGQCLVILGSVRVGFE